MTEIERAQLQVLQHILDAQTSFGGQGIPATITALDTGGSPAQAASRLYGQDDPNPGADQMFGDAAGNIEQLIIRVAQETHGLSGVGSAGLTVRQWRALLQALIWQERLR